MFIFFRDKNVMLFLKYKFFIKKKVLEKKLIFLVVFSRLELKKLYDFFIRK